MIIVCVDNTPIMLQNLKENAEKAYPQADVQAFRTVEPALEYAETVGCDILLCEINPPRLEGLFLAEKIKNINPTLTLSSNAVPCARYYNITILLWNRWSMD